MHFHVTLMLAGTRQREVYWQGYTVSSTTENGADGGPGGCWFSSGPGRPSEELHHRVSLQAFQQKGGFNYFEGEK